MKFLNKKKQTNQNMTDLFEMKRGVVRKILHEEKKKRINLCSCSFPRMPRRCYEVFRGFLKEKRECNAITRNRKKRKGDGFFFGHMDALSCLLLDRKFVFDIYSLIFLIKNFHFFSLFFFEKKQKSKSKNQKRFYTLLLLLNPSLFSIWWPQYRQNTAHVAYSKSHSLSIAGVSGRSNVM